MQMHESLGQRCFAAYGIVQFHWEFFNLKDKTVHVSIISLILLPNLSSSEVVLQFN